MKRVFLIMLLLMIALVCFAQSVIDDVSQEEGITEVISNEPVFTEYSNSPTSLIEDGVAKILAALLSALTGWLCFLIQKYLKIKIMTGQVNGYIVRKTEELDPLPKSNDKKREMAVYHIEKNKKISKWAKILYGGLDEAVSVVYKSIVKKAVKSLS